MIRAAFGQRMRARHDGIGNEAVRGTSISLTVDRRATTRSAWPARSTHDAALEPASAGMAWPEERFENGRALEGRGGQYGSPIGQGVLSERPATAPFFPPRSPPGRGDSQHLRGRWGDLAK
jgi:hypothetical protein